jgi:hypothetical protein
MAVGELGRQCDRPSGIDERPVKKLADRSTCRKEGGVDRLRKRAGRKCLRVARVQANGWQNVTAISIERCRQMS